MLVAPRPYSPNCPMPQPLPRRSNQLAVATSNYVRTAAIGLILVGFIIGLLLTYEYARLAATGYKITRVKQEIAALQSANEKLQLEIAKLKSLERIEIIATTKLGMEKPRDKVQLVFINELEPAVRMAHYHSEAEENMVGQKENHPFLAALVRLFSDWALGAKAVEASQR
ncbi:cell division protein FtsL [Calderihabitans maritimus]|uniref:cell division protein FtsL n=1 Tax=Calderihabitans maritimus TaxID=1246530 RepID=UPI0018647CBE|nr:cell division protein FtsL [Calderihabitans maritimus]